MKDPVETCVKIFKAIKQHQLQIMQLRKELKENLIKVPPGEMPRLNIEMAATDELHLKKLLELEEACLVESGSYQTVINKMKENQ